MPASGDVLLFTFKLLARLVVFPDVDEFAGVSSVAGTVFSVLKIVSMHNLEG